MRRLLLATILLLISAPTHAAGPAADATAQVTQATRIETDQKTGAIRFIVDGREVARFERDGLHVRKDVNYGGLLTDTGQAGYAKNHVDEPEPKH